MWLQRYRGSRDGAVVRALASHQSFPGSIRGLGVMWVEFVVGSRACSKGFSPGTLVFQPLQKPTFQISIRPGNGGEKSQSVDSTEIPIYLFCFILFKTVTSSDGWPLFQPLFSTYTLMDQCYWSLFIF